MKYICTGRVHPERADVNFGPMEFGTEGGGRVKASCDSSQITIVLDEVASVDGWIAAHIAADDLSGIFVGALGLSLGSGYRVEIIQVTEEDGMPHVFGVRPTGTAPEETLAVNPHISLFNRAFALSGRDVFFRLAVRDYLQAMNETADCATYCYRAIEAIKYAFVSRTGREGWEALHEVIGTTRTEITTVVKAYADPVRHGNWIQSKTTTLEERWRMLVLTRDILLRYLDHVEGAA